ncbi:hypothetical protein V1264_016842 [Littorina saxatilis]|uniref:Uncharacterized protein n=1 Tax=Littorina saxatilis TaxID=31220 RepID=A0AAN9GG23_9CAEN
MTSTTSLPKEDVRFYLLLGFIGFVLLIVVVLFAVFSWKHRARRLPPPPAPHNVRRARCGAVMFHAAQDGSDSTVSMHEYAEIPDDDDSSTHENSQRSVHASSLSASSLSDSSMSDDCLHHIACPSTDSSLPEDYLNPVASDWESCEDTFETTLFEDFPNEHVNHLPCLIVEP